jgi:hypothetical protein
VGNGVTLVNSDSVWERLVIDAKARGRFHNADENESLAEAITAALVDQVSISCSVDRNDARKSNPLKSDPMQLLVDQLALLTLKDE